MGSRLAAVERLERLDRLTVQPDAAGAREPVVERVTDEDVLEAQPAGAPGEIREDAVGDRLVGQVEQLVFGDIAHVNERRERELAAEHRGEHEHPVALVREVREPARDHVAQASRHGAPTFSGRRGIDALCRKQAHDLPHEQRIALGFLVQRRDQLRRGELRCRQVDVFRSLVSAQAAQ